MFPKDEWKKCDKSEKVNNKFAMSSENQNICKLFRAWKGSLIVIGWIKKTNVKFINQVENSASLFKITIPILFPN